MTWHAQWQVRVQPVAQGAAARHLGDRCDAEEVRQRGEPAKDVEQAPIVEVAELGDPEWRALATTTKLGDVCTQYRSVARAEAPSAAPCMVGEHREARRREQPAEMKRPFTICTVRPSTHSEARYRRGQRSGRTAVCLL